MIQIYVNLSVSGTSLTFYSLGKEVGRSRQMQGFGRRLKCGQELVFTRSAFPEVWART